MGWGKDSWIGKAEAPHASKANKEFMHHFPLAGKNKNRMIQVSKH